MGNDQDDGNKKPGLYDWGLTLEEFSLGNLLDEPTVELKCSCGVWKVYGRTYPVSRHLPYCDLVRGD